MSFGGGEQTTQSQGHSFYDPKQTALVDNYAQSVAAAAQPGGALAYKPYSGPGLSFGDPSSLTALANYTAPTANASTYQAATINPSSVPTVTAQPLTGVDLSGYMNPYTQSVVDTTNAQLARQNQIDNTNAAAQATAAGAFGGSRSAVLQNLNTDSYQRNLAATDAQLNQANFANAQGAAQTDIANSLTAQQANQNAGLTIGAANQNAQNTAGQFNAGAANTASLANQQADLAAAQTKLQALGLNAQQAQAMWGTDWAQFLNSQTDPQAVQQLVTQAYGLIPTAPLSQQSSFGQGVNFKFGV